MKYHNKIDTEINNDYPTTTLDFYIVGRVLGKGSFGKVNLCLHKLSGKLIAMKSMSNKYLNKRNNKEKVQNEIDILRTLKHRNIMRLYETFNTNNLMIIVLELCSGGDLLDYIKKRKSIVEPIAKVAFKQVWFLLKP